MARVDLDELTRASGEPVKLWEDRLAEQVEKRANRRDAAWRIVVTPEGGALTAHVFSSADLSSVRPRETSLATGFDPLDADDAFELLHSALVVGQTRKVRGSRRWPLNDHQIATETDWQGLFDGLSDQQLASLRDRLVEKHGWMRGEGVILPTEGWTVEGFNAVVKWEVARIVAWDVVGDEAEAA